MYEAFYGFKEKPFSMLPDPGFLFLSKKHQTALTLLEYAVLNHVGFCVISGEPGAGKTTVLRALLERVADNVKVGLITNTHQSFGSLLDWVLSAFDLHQPNLTQVEMHQIFMEYLIAEYANNRSVLLIVDEAQNMKPDVLEELRLLSNVNSEKDQLMQVVLAGQPALKDNLRKPKLMQFAQRIAVDYHLGPLNHEETCGYIQHRLITAGAEKEVFTPAACERIYSYSGGTPRLINLLCETVLVYGFADQQELIDVDLVDEMVLERMKDSVVPIVNRDIAKQGIIKTREELEKDFPWMKPKEEVQESKYELDIRFQEKRKANREKARRKKVMPVASTEKAPPVAVDAKKDIANEKSVKASSRVKAQEIPGDKRPSTTDQLKTAEKIKEKNTSDSISSAKLTTFILESDEDITPHKKNRYGAVIVLIVFFIIMLIAFGLGEEVKMKALNTVNNVVDSVVDSVNGTVINNAVELKVQSEQDEEVHILRLQQEKARVLQLQIEAETLKKERDAAIANAEEKARAKQLAEEQAAEKAALAGRAAEEKLKLEQEKRLAMAKESERLAKLGEAKAKEEIEKARHKTELLEEERLAMQARLDEAQRLQQEQEARRLKLVWQENLRQEILEAENKAKADTIAAEAAATVEVSPAASEVKKKLAECAGPTARFKANCR